MHPRLGDLANDQRGDAVRCLGTPLIPTESRGLCFVAAEESEAVRVANEMTKVPFTRIVEAMELLA